MPINTTFVTRSPYARCAARNSPTISPALKLRYPILTTRAKNSQTYIPPDSTRKPFGVPPLELIPLQSVRYHASDSGFSCPVEDELTSTSSRGFNKNVIHPKPGVRIREDYSFHPMIELAACRAIAISVLRKPVAMILQPCQLVAIETVNKRRSAIIPADRDNS